MVAHDEFCGFVVGADGKVKVSCTCHKIRQIRQSERRKIALKEGADGPMMVGVMLAYDVLEPDIEHAFAKRVLKETEKAQGDYKYIQGVQYVRTVIKKLGKV